MKNIRSYENFSVNENLDNSDMGKIIIEGISDKVDKKFLDDCKKYCKQKLVPLKFEGYVNDQGGTTLGYFKMVGEDKSGLNTLETSVFLSIDCDPLEKDLIINVMFGKGTDEESKWKYHYEKTYSTNFLTSDISVIKNAVDKIVYLNNLMFKNFAEKSGIPKNVAVEQQKKFKEILIKDGFETEDGDSKGGLFGTGGLFNSLFKSSGTMRRI